MADDVFEADVLIVGGGPGGLAGAIRLAQLAKKDGKELTIVVIEKGREIGAHQLSGAVFDERAIAELIPDWKEKGAPIETTVREHLVWYLNDNDHIPLPLPEEVDDTGHSVISLGQFTRWMGKQAEELGINIFTSMPGEELLYDKGRVIGVKVGDKGVDKHGKPRGNFEPGIKIHAKVTLLSEGTLGTLTRELIKRYKLDEGRNPQVWATGTKEVWELPEGQFPSGRVIYTAGWPLKKKMFGGAFLYSLANNRVCIGIVVGLDYPDPGTDIHYLLQQVKTHPAIAPIFKGGKLLEYGAKTIPEGGFHSIPKLVAPGALLVGDSAGFVNMMRLKGVHLAMKTGMLAAESAYEAVTQSMEQLEGYEKKVRDSWAMKEMMEARLYKQGFKLGFLPGMLNVGMIQMTGGWSPVPSEIPAGHTRMKPQSKFAPEPKIKFDGKLTFSKLDSVYYSNTKHDEDSRCHLIVPDPTLCVERCAKEFGNPCQNFCPANVYEWVTDQTAPQGRLQIGFGNCVHCKTCDIMDPYQNIVWVVPEGGGGPNWQSL
jgi:electron-transferring-flavoprotein dehydrogenase